MDILAQLPISELAKVAVKEPTLPGHTDQGHHTETFRMRTHASTPDTEVPQVVIMLGAIICTDCMPLNQPPFAENTTPFGIFVMLQSQ